MSQVDKIKTFLNEYKKYNEAELNKDLPYDEKALIWGIIHGINATQSYIEAMLKDE